MTQPDSAMAAAREIDKKVLRYETSEIEADPVTWLAAIIRKHQAQEIGELVECLRDLLGYADGSTFGGFGKMNARVQAILSRYQKV